MPQLPYLGSETEPGLTIPVASCHTEFAIAAREHLEAACPRPYGRIRGEIKWGMSAREKRELRAVRAVPACCKRGVCGLRGRPMGKSQSNPNIECDESRHARSPERAAGE